MENTLVSLIVRTINRPELPEALECIGQQTYNNIEIIVVDALGKNKLPVESFYGNFPVRIISKNKHLLIPEAANAGLDAVKGDFFGFLDEDDLIDKNHVSNLFRVLKDSDAIAAYSDIKMVDQKGDFLQNFDEDYSFERLLLGNFIPIHALLIRSKVLELGCRSDESLRIYDDWDFLLQLAQHGKFRHLPQTTGIYRNFNTSGVNHDNEKIQRYRKIIYAKWKDKLTAEEYFNFIDYLNLKHGKQLEDNLQSQITKAEMRWQEEHQRNVRLNTALMQAKSDLNSVQMSLSWKLTAPLRKIASQIRFLLRRKK